MACLVVSIAMTFLTFALLLSSSVPKVASTSPASSLIKDVCVGTEVHIDYKFCIEVLNSEPRVVSASDLVDISIAVIEAGISNVTNTQSYVKNLLKQSRLKPDYIYVLQQCDTGYDHCRWSFGSALGEVKDKVYDMATYDLLVGYTDSIDQCQNALSSKNVKDGAISKGNEFMRVFGAVAFQTVARLESTRTIIL